MALKLNRGLTAAAGLCKYVSEIRLDCSDGGDGDGSGRKRDRQVES